MKLVNDFVGAGMSIIVLLSNLGLYPQKLEVKKDLHKEIQLKIKESDEEFKNMTVEFKPLERFEFDSEGRETYYEDLSNGAWFYDIYEYYNKAELKGKQNDKKRIATYDKNGRNTYLVKENAKGEEELVREYGKNGTPIHIKGNIMDFKDFFENRDVDVYWRSCTEIWLDENGNVTHAISDHGFEEWFEYDENSNCLHKWNNKGYDCKSEYDKDGNRIHLYVKSPTTYSSYSKDATKEMWMTYSADGKMLTEKSELNFYDDNTYTNKVSFNNFYSEYEYDSQGRLITDNTIVSDTTYEVEDEFYRMKISYIYSDDERTFTERTEYHYYEDDAFAELIYSELEEIETLNDEKGRPLRILTRGCERWDIDEPNPDFDYEDEELYSYDADGTQHHIISTGEEDAYSPNGNIVYSKQNIYSNEWREERYLDNDRKQDTYATHYKILKNGKKEVTYEAWTEYDDAGRETHYKYLSYTSDRHPQEESWHEYTPGGNLKYEKKLKVEYEDPDTGLYSPVKTEKTEEYISTFDEHENELSLDMYENGEKTDYSRKGSYKYDDQGRMTYEFHGNYYEGKLSENTEGWYEYDENGYLTHKKLKGYSTSSFGSYKPESVPMCEYFFVNQYSYHNNGKVKECVRYYYKNEFYERDWQPDLLRLADIEEAKQPKKPVIVPDPMNDGKDYVEEIRFESSSKYIGINNNFWGVVANTTAPVYENIQHKFGDEPAFTMKKGDAVKLHAVSKDGYQYGSGDFFHRWKIETDDGKTGWISGHDLIPVGMRNDVPPIYANYFVVVGSYPGYLMDAGKFTLCVTGSSYGSMGFYNGDIRYDTGMTGDTPFYMEGFVVSRTDRKRAYRWNEEGGCFVSEYYEKAKDSDQWKLVETNESSTSENETILRIKGYYYSEEYYAAKNAIEDNDMDLLSKVIASGYKADTMEEDQSLLLCAIRNNNQTALDMMLENGFSRYVYVPGEEDVYMVDIDEWR